MNDVLPSYEAANTRDYWPIVAQYIPSRDLCSAALVCRQWHRIFTRQLWGNPASHFGVENDVVYVALVRFKRTLSWARLSTRELTHTLHFPPAHAEIYDGPHSDWLRDVLERLPRLQSLVVRGLPFFDHGALITLRRPSNLRLSSHSDSLPRMTHDFPLFWLRYLDASACTNATYSGLAEALQHFPALLYLDLSKTKSAKGADVLSVLKFCHSLRVLKLRSLALKDAEIEALATAVKTRLKSLDVRDNQLTDASARLLLDNCFNIKRKSCVTHLNGQSTPSEQLPPSPASPSSPLRHPLLFDQYDKEDLDQVLRAKLVGEFAGSAFINDVYTDGITHLYISDNNLTVEGVSGLLRSKKLQVFDAGTVAREPQDDFFMPGAEKLTPVIKKYASDKMTYLRIHHAVITEETAVADLSVGRVELQGDLGIYSPPTAHELDGFNEIHEAPTENRAIYEMPNNQALPAELPAYDNQFIKDCAEETFIAKLMAKGAYALPPGRDRQLAEREYARSQFGLHRLVLEMAPLGDPMSPKKPTTTWRQYPSKSSTEDADSEAFWSAAERDFSFFGDEECGVPSLEPGRTLPLADMSEKVVMPSIADPPPVLLQQARPRRMFDVVSELSSFRKDRKAAYLAALQRGENDPEVEGYWEGEIKVVRPPPPEDTRNGEVDCYGNYYEKGYNYR
ncbi:Beta-lactamase-related protein [Neofusicoccum parvum]|uniref:Beta-lactamase-related protein n=1 Tax=Neofusicoccum parvum TaxID=310453 RepID=A0ACB5SN30_9PEZI|nr:Beta-lactamase-related protein [Neofusicoccum parvum]